LNSKQNFISANSTLNLNAITCATSIYCQNSGILNNTNKDVILFAGNLTSGGVAVGNLGTYPIILQGTMSAAPILQNLASTWSTLNMIIPQQTLLNSTLYYGLSPTQLSSNSQASH
jgi:hypothetical protein